MPVIHSGATHGERAASKAAQSVLAAVGETKTSGKGALTEVRFVRAPEWMAWQPPSSQRA